MQGEVAGCRVQDDVAPIRVLGEPAHTVVDPELDGAHQGVRLHLLIGHLGDGGVGEGGGAGGVSGGRGRAGGE